jgi:micrococcal nuclease
VSNKAIKTIMKFINFLLVLFLCCSVPAYADIYQWQDKEGSKHFSDRNHQDSKKIEIKPGYAYTKVNAVYDGDTIRLEDGRKIRLLGINTPEVKHRNNDTESGGEAAKRWLENKLKNQRVRLVTDVEKTDKYKRILGHVFTENKEHINLTLVELGLAAVNIYPPNLLYVDELAAAEKIAEQTKRGIWQQQQYAVLPVDRLEGKGHSGWTRIVSKVSVIRSSRKFVYLEFSDFFQARIEKKWLSLFPDIYSYRSQTIEVRGWLNKNRGGWSMLIRHPSAIEKIAHI